MREIKFRAWDNLSKKIVAFNGRKWCRKYGQHINIQYTIEKDDTVLKLISKFFYGSDLELIYMQYTGLKDKNGVEIYEGDILYHDLQGTRFVEYGSPFKNFGGYMLVSKNGMRGTLNDADRLYQVIGNIYENPDLLNNN